MEWNPFVETKLSANFTVKILGLDVDCYNGIPLGR